MWPRRCETQGPPDLPHVWVMKWLSVSCQHWFNCFKPLLFPSGYPAKVSKQFPYCNLIRCVCGCVCAARQMSEALLQPAAPRVEVVHLYTDLLIHTHKDLDIYTHILECLALGLQQAVFFLIIWVITMFETFIKIMKSLLHSVGDNIKNTQSLSACIINLTCHW